MALEDVILKLVTVVERNNELLVKSQALYSGSMNLNGLNSAASDLLGGEGDGDAGKGGGKAETATTTTKATTAKDKAKADSAAKGKGKGPTEEEIRAVCKAFMEVDDIEERDARKAVMKDLNAEFKIDRATALIGDPRGHELIARIKKALEVAEKEEVVAANTDDDLV